MHDLGFIAPFEYLNPDLNEAVAELSRYADLKELSNYQQPRGLLRHREAGAHWAGRYGWLFRRRTSLSVRERSTHS